MAADEVTSLARYSRPRDRALASWPQWAHWRGGIVIITVHEDSLVTYS